MMDRRAFLTTSVLLPIALPTVLAGCGRRGDWPEGMAAIAWDRDTCTRCSMVISDRRFAVEVRGGPKNDVLKFDDIGCAVFWARDHAADTPWLAAADSRWWVADAANQGERLAWHDARIAQYVGKTSPMGYNFAAVAHPQAGSVDFATLREHVLARGR